MTLTSIVAQIAAIFKRFTATNSYASELERFIVSRNPQDASDIDRLTKAYELQISQGKFL